MSRKYEKLRKQILILHELHQNWSSTDIANELMNSDCPPSQTRSPLIRYVNYTIKRGTIEARKRNVGYLSGGFEYFPGRFVQALDQV